MPQRNPPIRSLPAAQQQKPAFLPNSLGNSNAHRLGPGFCEYSCFVGLGAFQVEIEASKFHVGRLGDLDVALRAVHDVNVVAQAFDHAGLVGGANLIGEGSGESLLEQSSAEN